jgi:hypothetical protein
MIYSFDDFGYLDDFDDFGYLDDFDDFGYLDDFEAYRRRVAKSFDDGDQHLVFWTNIDKEELEDYLALSGKLGIPMRILDNATDIYENPLKSCYAVYIFPHTMDYFAELLFAWRAISEEGSDISFVVRYYELSEEAKLRKNL